MDTRSAYPTVIARLDRATQYAAASRFISDVPAYWSPAFAGMTSRVRGGERDDDEA
jgi:hypothetical protein